MRLLSWLIGLAVAVLVVAFAVTNRQTVTVGMWPFAQGVAAPAYLVALVPLAIGLVLGILLASVGTMRARLRTRTHASRVRALEREMARLRAAPTAIAPPSMPADAGRNP
jgi:uncharacterized membrane protein YciS (DUF1049 family)